MSLCSRRVGRVQCVTVSSGSSFVFENSYTFQSRLGDFQQFSVCSQGQTESTVGRSCRWKFVGIWAAFIESILQDCSIMFKNETNWFCGSSVCFYLQLTSPSSDFLLVSVVHHRPGATSMHLQGRNSGCLLRALCLAPAYSGRSVWGNMASSH